MEDIEVNGNIYKIIKLLGHGKGGYSYLAEKDGKPVCLKQIHHEPCDYYQFGNKIEAEKNDYNRLIAANIPVPKLIEIDEKNERLVKEFVSGKTIFDLVKSDADISGSLEQVRKMADLAKNANLNIDYFPTNFVVSDSEENKGLLFYIDYECNGYMDEWSFENWGIKYWSKTEDFMNYLKQTEKK